MWTARNLLHRLDGSSSDQRPNLRRYGRLKCDMLTSTVGDVLDLSAGGMKVLYCGKVAVEQGQTLEVNLQAAHVTQIVKARVVHVRKVAFRRYHLGLEFIEVTPEITAGLIALARIAMDSMTLGHGLT